MARKMVAPIEVPQLTPAQKAAARAELQKIIDRAAADGVYERLLALEGKVNWPTPYEELRDKSDDRD
ncbi:MAG: hypothetical protein JWO56_3411 [Acidobacteria bacterium]|nr:hypothetical protein [Acidobacteriota bacterium]